MLRLRSTSYTVVSILLCLGAVVPGFGGKTEINPVSVTFQPSTGDRIQGDTLGQVYTHGADDVQAVLQSGGDLGFHTAYSSRNPGPRKLWLDFTDPVDPANPTRFTTYARAYMKTVVYDSSGNHVGLRGMQIGSTAEANVEIRFDYAGVTWALHFNNNPGNSRVKVTRLDEDDWRLETDASLGHTARLWSNVGVRGGQDQGWYHMPFRCAVHKLF